MTKRQRNEKREYTLICFSYTPYELGLDVLKQAGLKTGKNDCFVIDVDKRKVIYGGKYAKKLFTYLRKRRVNSTRCKE